MKCKGKVMDIKVVDFANLEVHCDQCGKMTYPEPDQYCDHVMFIYVSDFEGLWVYVNDKAMTIIDSTLEYDENDLELLCNIKGWKLQKYEHNEPSSYGKSSYYLAAVSCISR